jgi:uncharacterized protein YndB with AHSA1/START domain
MDTFDHVYSVYIQAPPERVWRAITDGDETVRYYYGTRFASSLESGAPLTYAYPDGSIAADGRIIEIDPPKRLRMTFHARWDPEIGPRTGRDGTGHGGRCEARADGHDLRPEGRPKTAADFAGGIVYIVRLKTVIETGQPLAAGQQLTPSAAEEPPTAVDPEVRRVP